MIIKYDKPLFKKLKKVDVRIRKQFKKQIALFIKNPHDPKLRNHSLKREYKGSRSINVNADYRAIYQEIHEGNDTVYLFFELGTHKELYE